jgi:hypothetical protein
MLTVCFVVSRMSDDSASQDGVVLRFVLPRGKNETTCSDELSDAHDKCEEHEMKPKWIASDDAMELTPTKTVWVAIDKILILCALRLTGSGKLGGGGATQDESSQGTKGKKMCV